MKIEIKSGMLWLLMLLACFHSSFAQDEKIEIEGSIRIGNHENTPPGPGTIRWTGSDFEGWNGSAWISLTQAGSGSYFFRDKDEDTYGDLFNPTWVAGGISPPTYFVADSSDCNDQDPLINPAATEICDGMDNNCNGMVDEGEVCTPIIIDTVLASLAHIDLPSQHSIMVSGFSTSMPPQLLQIINNDTSFSINFQWGEDQINLITFILPSGLIPGLFDVKITAFNSNFGELMDGFQLTDDITVDIDSGSPSVVPDNQDTQILIDAVDPPQPGSSQFVDLPFVFLHNGGLSSAIQLQQVVFIDATQISAHVPSGLSAGMYDLWVINPDGTSGVLINAIEVSGT
jgi:hypothetical protein